MIVLGLDIGSNSVGSAWVDTENKVVRLAASVFPAGVDEQEDKRGAPKNQARRMTRSQRRNIHRRAMRKRRIVNFLMDQGLLPRETAALSGLYDSDPWAVRRKALKEPLTVHEFGRVVVHLSQRRGAVGVTTDPDDPDEGKVKEGMDRLNKLMQERDAETIGQLMADLIDERRRSHVGVSWNEPVRNRQYRIAEADQLFAGRELIRKEFHTIVERQRSFKGSELAAMLTDTLFRELDDPRQTDAWRHRGLLFGQRRTYWDTGTLGRCDLEPTERCAPIADRHASYYRVVETVNNIIIRTLGQSDRPLSEQQREDVKKLLRGPLGERKSKGKLIPKTSVSASDIRQALGLGKRKGKSDPVQLSIEADEDRDINTDWFHREIVHGGIGEVVWNSWDESRREGVNRAILKFDPDEPDDASRLRKGAMEWWELDAAAADRLVEAWKNRPRLEKRLNLSRRAIRNLLPFMEAFDNATNRWPTQQEARKAFAKTLTDKHARRRYETAAPGLTARDRYYMRQKKHQITEGTPALPPAPTLSNPVVRKAIHEVRRHVIAYLRQYGRKPDRVVIEMARVTKQSERQRNDALARNRARDKIRKNIIDEVLPTAFGTAVSRLSLNQQRSAVERVILARQQTQICPYCGKAGLTEKIAAKGDDLEIDHIVPYSRCGDNSLNNKVLVHRECNRGKANHTPREWWRAEFDERIQFAEKLFKDAEPEKGDYFRKRDFDRKWQNFTREIREGEEWKNSQLSDTAYAARQVAAYLADALYDGRGLPERGDGADRQRIFFTMGRFTSMLRRDWQLFETLKPDSGGMSADEELLLAEKNRGDHRQHALDAVAIALTEPDIKNRLSSWAASAAEYHEKFGKWPRRDAIIPPWADIPTFRRQILALVYDRFDGISSESAVEHKRLTVAHRPVKRRLVGAFHEATLYGPVVEPLPPHRTENAETLYTNRISADRLKPNHLRVPEGWDQQSVLLDNKSLPLNENRRIRRQLASMPDPPPGKSGIVRDRALRDRLRKCLRADGLDPDDFTANQLKPLIKEGRLTMASGVPIKGVVLLRTNTDPIIMPRKRWDAATNRMVIDEDPRTKRVYIGGNNHHIEIREDDRGRWTGAIVTTYDAARRVRIHKRDAVDRSDNADGRFVMSLAEGEMVHMKHPQKGYMDYFVVFKLDKPRTVQFIHHWDARPSGERKDLDGKPIPGSAREEIPIVVGKLKDLGPEPGKPPLKVRVGPLGDVTVLEKD
ncbi:MAG: type II CRISPR RNA-guided endonuclease Cas9 [Planctomycetota bacterium]|nr:MAG: type II CRISPR RNA-guided endonuclease Cas9 [Planctomycetota bacterium]